jgi:predicted nucleotidyltransferase
MPDNQTINDFKNRLVEIYQPEKVILFGSYASGKVHADSDVDILVILSFEGKNPVKSAEILNRIDPRFPIDLIVRTPEQVRERQKNNDFFIKEIIEKGVILYEAHHP